MARHISEEFLNEFLNGSLKNILDYIHQDHTLDMELRRTEVTIYYRGGKLFSIKEDGYTLVPFDEKYTKPVNEHIPDINNIKDYIPKAKHIMDAWFAKTRKWERELQQQIIIENNYSPTAEDTDYFIIDMEYKDIGRADIVALRWDSTTTAHKLKSYKPKLTIFELKQGCDSIAGNSGIVKHYDDFKASYSNPKKKEDFIDDMIEIFAQKRKLGLIPYLDKNLKKKEVHDVDKEIDFIVILANYKSASTQLSKIDIKKLIGCKFIFANGMGYGLFSKNVVDLSDFLKKFKVKNVK